MGDINIACKAYMEAHLVGDSLAQIRLLETLKLSILNCLDLLKFNLQIPPLEKSDVVRPENPVGASQI
jgi:hypothetical protein